MTDKYILVEGPSRETLFDCLRLGTDSKSMTVVFAAKYNENVTPRLYGDVHICGIHQADKKGDEWFIWAELPWFRPEQGFMFARWNTKQRTGTAIFSDKSYFVNPMTSDVVYEAVKKHHDHFTALVYKSNVPTEEIAQISEACRQELSGCIEPEYDGNENRT